MQSRIAVVGAGIAGLTAAYMLKQAGASPFVLESSPRVGGRMVSDFLDGFTIDAGAQFLTDQYRVIPELVERLGMSAQVVSTSQNIATVRNGTLHRFRLDSDFSSLRSGLLGPGAWLRFGFQRYLLLRRLRSLATHEIVAWEPYDDMDARKWSTTTFGREVTDYVSEPQIGGLLLQSLEENSRAMVMAMQLMLLYRRAKTLAVKGGIGSIPETLASHLDVRLDSRVDALVVGTQGVELTVGTETIPADAAILATPASSARDLYSSSSALEDRLLSTPYSSSMTVALILSPDFHIDPVVEHTYGTFVPQVEGGEVASFSIERGKNNSCLGDGKMITAFLRSQSALAMMDWEDSRVVASVVANIRQYFPGLEEKLTQSKVYRWKEAMPLTPIGRTRNVASYRRGVDPSARLLLAGDYMAMPYTDGAAESGTWAAKALLKRSV